MNQERYKKFVDAINNNTQEIQSVLMDFIDDITSYIGILEDPNITPASGNKKDLIKIFRILENADNKIEVII